ncbi:MAG: hypothetical protein ACRDYZ_13800, partial [Acidimicrobiales bacterium]
MKGSEGSMENLSGGTTNLLRMARSECRGAAAFVALALDDDMFATATYRAVPDDELFRSEAVDDLIRQAWADPEFSQGRALVRVARLGGRRLAPARRMALAIVPLVDGPGDRPWGMLGVAGPESGSFDARQIDLLNRIAQRLSSYFRARHEVRQKISPVGPPSAPDTGPTAGGPQPQPQRQEQPGWTVEPGPATGAPAGEPDWSLVLEPESPAPGAKPAWGGQQGQPAQPWGGQQGQPAQPPAQPSAQPSAQPWGGPEQPQPAQQGQPAQPWGG